MKKTFVLFFFTLNILYANINLNYSSKDLKILKNLDINESFLYDKELKLIFEKYSRKSHLRTYVKNIKNAKHYVSSIENIIEEENLPKELLFMPMAESNFKVNVKSNAKAAGIWQFIPRTAEKFKLRNDDYVDERLDFIKSTKAAISYLKENHNRFDKWYLSVLAYNCGEGRVIEAITRAKIDKYVMLNPEKKNSKTIKDFRKTLKEFFETKKNFNKVNKIYKKVSKWNIKLTATDLMNVQDRIFRQYLPQESRIYLKKILAFNMLGNRNFYEKEPLFKKTNEVVTVQANGGLHIRDIANSINIDSKKLKKLNLHLKEDILPNNVKLYDINILENKVSLFNKNISKIENKSFTIHKVKSGETLSSIGRKYKIRYGIIKDYNEMKNNRLKVNQELIIPVKREYLVHKVESGDTLYDLAKEYNITYKRIKEKNDLKTNRLSINQKLIIPIANN